MVNVWFLYLKNQLALERFGSYFVEKLYHAVDVENKVCDVSVFSTFFHSSYPSCSSSRLLYSQKVIVEELAANLHRLSSTVSGKFLLYALKIEEYKHKGQDWAQKRATSEKVKREFEEFLGDGDEKTNSKSTSDAGKSKKQSAKVNF